MLQPDQAKTAAVLVREMRIALSNFFLYAADNAMVKQSVEKFLMVLGQLFQALPAVSLGESEGRLVVEGTALDERATGSTNMIKDLFLTHKIHSMTFQLGLELPELEKFLSLLKPRALPADQTLFSAIEVKGIQHIKVNEKMFVAVKEGEKLVAVGEGMEGMETQENFDEALEALQYFLQIFARVRPEANKKEVAKKMMGQMNGILTADDLKEVGLPVPAPSGEAQGNWSQMMVSFLSLKKSLASIKDPGELPSLQVTMEDLLKKLVLLGESQGLGGGGTGTGGPGGESSPTDDRLTLFETDPVLSALDENDLSKLSSASQEGIVAQHLARLQEPGEEERFEKLWKGLWHSALGSPGEARNVSLRQLQRLDWGKIPRPLQREGLQRLRELFAVGQTAESFPIVMGLYQSWVSHEISDPEWPEMILGAAALKGIAFRTEQEFPNQAAQAKAALEAVFNRSALEHLDGLYVAPGMELETREKFFELLDYLTGPYFVQRAIDSPPDTEASKRAYHWLDLFQTHRVPVLEKWFQSGAPADRMRLFLELFKKLPPSPALFEIFGKNWGGLTFDQKLQVIEIVERWRWSAFRPRIIELMGAMDKDLSLPALRIMDKIGLEGDSLLIVEAVKAYGLENPLRDDFWVEACRVLGQLAEAYTINILVEWASSYHFLEKKTERPMALRAAAVEALGQFRSQYARKFLLKLEKDAEKELRPSVEKALKSLGERLSETMEVDAFEQRE